MSRQDANAAFARTSFLYGGNAAYVEQLQSRYEANPASVDAEWRAFFESLKDERGDVIKNASGPSWQRPNLQHANGELIAALTGDWSEVEKTVGDKIKGKAQAKGVEISAADVQQATRDSIRALMLIRAYRIRGHFHAKLDPLGLEAEKNEAELDPRSYGFTEADLDRKIFLDKVLGLEFATLARDPRDPAPHLLPDARRRVPAHLRSGAEGLDPGAHRGPRQGDQLHPRGQARDPQQAGRGRRLREVLRREVHRHQALRPRRRRVDDPGAGADHQARRRARRQRNHHRHGAPRPAQRAVAGDEQAAPRDLPRVQGRLVVARRRRRLGRREVSPRRLVGPRVRRQPACICR